MKRAPAQPPSEYRIKFLTADGSLIMDRDTEEWVLKDLNFMLFTMGCDARRKGVRIVSYRLEDKVAAAVVEWL